MRLQMPLADRGPTTPTTRSTTTTSHFQCDPSVSTITEPDATEEYAPKTWRLLRLLSVIRLPGLHHIPSTGRLSPDDISMFIQFRLTYFPPAPKPVHATNAANDVKLLAPPAAMPKIPAMHNVI